MYTWRIRYPYGLGNLVYFLFENFDEIWLKIIKLSDTCFALVYINNSIDENKKDKNRKERNDAV